MYEDRRLEKGENCVCNLIVLLSSLKHETMGKVSSYSLGENVSLNAIAYRIQNPEKQSNFQITNGCCFPWCRCVLVVMVLSVFGMHILHKCQGKQY